MLANSSPSGEMKKSKLGPIKYEGTARTVRIDRIADGDDQLLQHDVGADP